MLSAEESALFRNPGAERDVMGVTGSRGGSGTVQCFPEESRLRRLGAPKEPRSSAPMTQRRKRAVLIFCDKFQPNEIQGGTEVPNLMFKATMGPHTRWG